MKPDPKGIVFFFYTKKFVGHSFIQIRKSFFFFPKTRKKKTSWFFDFSRKFPENFLFFFFSRKCSSAIHSFDFKTVFLFPGTGKKKQHFHSFIRFSPKSAQKRTFPGKKKYDTFEWWERIYLWWKSYFIINVMRSPFPIKKMTMKMGEVERNYNRQAISA